MAQQYIPIQLLQGHMLKKADLAQARKETWYLTVFKKKKKKNKLDFLLYVCQMELLIAFYYA